MSIISCVLIDCNSHILAPAVLDLDTFEITKISSTIDALKDFSPDLVGIYTNDYKSPFRTYSLNFDNDKIAIKNTVAKKAIVGWSRAMSKEGGQLILETDKILKTQKFLEQALSKNSQNSNQEAKTPKLNKI